MASGSGCVPVPAGRFSPRAAARGASGCPPSVGRDGGPCSLLSGSFSESAVFAKGAPPVADPRDPPASPEGGVVLPQQARVRRPQQFRLVTRTGRRAGGRTVTAHLLLVPDGEPAKVGFVVSRAVGSAVVRNRVKRRLREIMRARLASLPEGSMLVVRAQPAAAQARQSDLAADLDRILRRLVPGFATPGSPMQRLPIQRHPVQGPQ
jgi:ribonuclease P protein component